MSVIDIIQKSKSVIIDVRTPEKFKRDHVKSSINITLKEIFKRVEEIKSLKAPIVLFCMVGSISEKPRSSLNGRVIECNNGGGWMVVDRLVSQLA
jgi:rhodanese-related sulfurtransferase